MVLCLMKNISTFLSAIVLSTASLHLAASNTTREPDLKLEATKIVKTFSDVLKPKLQEAIKAGGLEHAVKVCSIEAPEIASKLSKDTGWSIKRVSLKPRNVTTAAPDDFELNILKQFDALQIKGVQPSLLEHSEIVGNQYRYMKAQAVEGVCLNCHGSSMSPELKTLLKEKYPADAATGYSLGEIRGAFSLSKAL